MTLKERQLVQYLVAEVEQLINVQMPDVQSMDSKASTLEQLSDRVDYLRCVTKYTLLDLESTKREKATLEKKLRGKNK